jgi:hypothetical protein
MTPHRQTIRHDPPHSYGDCHRTAVASLLDLHPSEVPHIYDNDTSAEDGSRVLDTWLAARGLESFVMASFSPVADVLSFMRRSNPTVYYLLSGRGPRGFDHTVVARGGEIVCDPVTGEADQGAIVDADSNGHVWITLIYPKLTAGEVKPDAD